MVYNQRTFFLFLFELAPGWTSELALYEVKIQIHYLVIDLRNEAQTINTVVHIHVRAQSNVTLPVASILLQIRYVLFQEKFDLRELIIISTSSIVLL